MLIQSYFFFASTFVSSANGRWERGKGLLERVRDLVSRSEVGTKRREETKVGYSMARVIARRHIRNARFKCDEERRKVKVEGEKEPRVTGGKREVAVDKQ